MNLEVLDVLDPGLSATFQDSGRFGWRRHGVPSSGAMDDHAAAWANRLLDNPLNSPVVELLLQGAKLALRQDTWLAITGADADANVPMWEVVRLPAGNIVQFPQNRSGVWIYIAVESGFDAPGLLGSASIYPRGGLGKPLGRGDILRRLPGAAFQLPNGVARRAAAWDERRNYTSPPPLRLWIGPQWGCFSDSDRELFFNQDWTVTSRSDRAGYRLSGIPLKSYTVQIISEPVRVGSIQVPQNGQPIVTMRDGPTTGGYPKLGMVDPADLSWLAQCRPGQKVRFQLVG